MFLDHFKTYDVEYLRGLAANERGLILSSLNTSRPFHSRSQSDCARALFDILIERRRLSISAAEIKALLEMARSCY